MIAKKNPNNVFSLFQQTNNTKNKPNQTNNSHFNKKEHTHDDVVLCYREKKKCYYHHGSNLGQVLSHVCLTTKLVVVFLKYFVHNNI